MTPVLTPLVSHWKAERSRGLKPAARDAARSAFTLVELLVVISIILVLLGAVIVAGPKLMDTGRSQTTQLMLVAVRDAIEEFKREQMEKPTLTRPLRGKQGVPCPTLRHYRDRYGAYPPDELEVFTTESQPFFCQGSSLLPGQAAIQPSPTGAAGKYSMDMLFYPQSPPTGNPEFRDNLALTLAIDLFGQSSKMMLEQIAANNRREVPPGASNAPSVYLDVNANNMYDADTDRGWYYLVDGWGVPISYFAERDVRGTPPDVLESSNHREYWGPASTGMVQRNGGQPVIVSYGPNGKDQLTPEVMADPKASMVGDWMYAGNVTAAERVIDNPLNRDNVYADPIVKQRLEAAP